MTRVRLADVAQRVGVSAKTVSNVVNGTGWVGPAVRERVLEAIRELGYRPNLAARQLRSGSSGLVALCVPSLREPYFAEFAAEFVDTARERKQTVLVTQSEGRRAVELAMLESEDLPALDGLVFSPLTLTREDIAARRSTIPLVLIGEHGESLATDTIAHVGPDSAAAAEAATSLLIARGRRRIAAIGLQTPDRETSRLRFEGYARALSAAGVEVDPRLLVDVDRYTRAEGSRGIAVLLERGVEFDAVFCFNDTLAFGALYTLGVRRIPVPDRVQVIGYDNIDEGGFIVPALDSVDPGVADSSGLILDLLAGPAESLGGHVSVPFRLVERSVGPRGSR